jgi:hypothetical protein
MNEIYSALFAPIYEKLFGLYDSDFSLIFDHLYDKGGYIEFGLLFILIPLVCWSFFYYVLKYPYGRIIHWLLCLIITIVVVSGSTYGVVRSEIFASNNEALNNAIADASTNYETYVSSLSLKYAIFNGLLSGVWGFVCSLVMKRFSKIQIHLPF